MQPNILVTTIALLGLTSTPTAFALSGPSYPAPGGTTFSGSGQIAGIGGRTANYSGFNNSQFEDLYWGIDKVNFPFGAGLNGTLVPLAFAGISGNTATWSGTTDYVDAYPFSGPGGTGTLYSVPVIFEMTLISGGAFVSAASIPGMDPSLGVVVDTLGGGNFSVNLAFKAPTLQETFLNTVDKMVGAGQTVTSFAGGFYWTDPAPVNAPEGGATALLLLPAALGVFALRANRKEA